MSSTHTPHALELRGFWSDRFNLLYRWSGARAAAQGRTEPFGVAPVGSSTSGERLAHLPGPLDLVALQVDRGRRDRGVAQIVPHGRRFRATRECMGRMGVAHPVGAGTQMP